MAISRGNSLLMTKQWAEDGSTVIPNPPVAGTTYRDESVDADNIAEGQQYDGVADSARWNQLLYIITGILKDTMAHGVLPWINTQDYSEGAVVMGSNGTLYIAKQANGPTAKNAKNPTTDSGESVWKAVIRLNDATMGLDSEGKILAKDIAIGGDASDLASARGQIGKVETITNANINTIIKSGCYCCRGVTSNAPNGNGIGFLVVYSQENADGTFISQLFILHTGNYDAYFTRKSSNNGDNWTNWNKIIDAQSSIGDGITVNNGIISVPEYEGATASAAATSGLVPPAAAGQQEYYLSGDGNWRAFTSGMPVGSIYVQFSGQSAPSDLFGGTWSNISNSYAGLFFRAEGGAAAAFGGTQSDGAPNISGTWTSGMFNGIWSSTGAFYKHANGGKESNSNDNGTIGGFEASRSNNKYGAADEVRPVNSTIRIWKRTA